MPFATSNTSQSLDQQNFFETTLKQDVSSASDTNIYLNTLPNPSEGFLVIDPTNADGREIIFYTSKGDDFVTCPSADAGRGVGGTSAQTHVSGTTVRMCDVSEYWRALQDGYALTDGAITASKLASNSVTTDKIEDSSIGSSKLAEFDKVRAVKITAGQTIPNATETAIILNSENFDTDSLHDNSTNPTRLTCRTAGKYIITGQINFTGNATGLREAQVRVNGTTSIASDNRVAGDANDRAVSVSTIYDLAVNDYIELYAYQNSGGDLIIKTDRTHLEMSLLA